MNNIELKHSVWIKFNDAESSDFDFRIYTSIDREEEPDALYYGQALEMVTAVVHDLLIGENDFFSLPLERVCDYKPGGGLYYKLATDAASTTKRKLINKNNVSWINIERVK